MPNPFSSFEDLPVLLLLVGIKDERIPLIFPSVAENMAGEETDTRSAVDLIEYPPVGDTFFDPVVEGKGLSGKLPPGT
jgi:hypothetical protein